MSRVAKLERAYFCAVEGVVSLVRNISKRVKRIRLAIKSANHWLPDGELRIRTPDRGRLCEVARAGGKRHRTLSGDRIECFESVCREPLVPQLKRTQTQQSQADEIEPREEMTRTEHARDH